MDYEEKYEQALERAKESLNDGTISQNTIDYLCNIFPELRESEDEKIRKELITWLKNSEGQTLPIDKYNAALAWLEKQGEHVNFLNKIQVGDKVTRNEYGMLVNLSQLKRVAKKNEKQGEQKPVDKVEPKFKVGDWVVNKLGDLWHIDSFDRKNYQVSNGKGNYNYFPISKQDEMHLWTIQDAKDGDVLTSDNKNCPFIYKTKTVFGSPVAYCGVRSDGLFISKSPEDNKWCLKSEVIPATKEQRDLMFAKMKEAGYEWDAEKKELKKIEQKPVEWGEEDEKALDIALLSLAHPFEHEGKYDREFAIEQLKSLKERLV